MWCEQCGEKINMTEHFQRVNPHRSISPICAILVEKCLVIYFSIGLIIDSFRICFRGLLILVGCSEKIFTNFDVTERVPTLKMQKLLWKMRRHAIIWSIINYVLLDEIILLFKYFLVILQHLHSLWRLIGPTHSIF